MSKKIMPSWVGLLLLFLTSSSFASYGSRGDADGSYKNQPPENTAASVIAEGMSCNACKSRAHNGNLNQGRLKWAQLNNSSNSTSKSNETRATN